MRYSRLFIPTLKEAPSEAEAISHKLMVRAGFVRQIAAGLYIYLPLGMRVMAKINQIIREEMNAIGGQEVTMPVLNPAEVWQQTGRWDAIGDEMFVSAIAPPTMASTPMARPMKRPMLLFFRSAPGA